MGAAVIVVNHGAGGAGASSLGVSVLFSSGSYPSSGVTDAHGNSIFSFVMRWYVWHSEIHTERDSPRPSRERNLAVCNAWTEPEGAQ